MVAAAVTASSCAKEISEKAVVPTVDMEFVADAGNSKTSLSEGGDGCNIAISKGTVDQVSGMKTCSTFYNTCQLIRFTIPSYLSNVTEVTIASQDHKAIAGTATFDFSGDEPVLSAFC